ncbi:hypothetical protein FIBSPDRAFT_839573 [Athelia psychrophila]|uniref:DUF3533 domain-containing protein n=1 Tax=Athelia psychrophila TaxID=1759441 RepID=A0A165Y5T1_9AGAM|nr:hypothetical protein FIBSPDRAFT_839573 [Fibularhizoctonia sp. CBS 109695]
MNVLRKGYFTIMVRCTVLIVMLMWATLPVYWGALASQAARTRNLNAWFVDRDDSRLGHALWSTFGNTSASGAQLGWTSIDPATAGTDADVAQAVLDEEAWIVVVVEENATENLWNARTRGNSSYNPKNAITVYYNQARNEVATGNYILPLTTALLQETTSAFATYAAQLYIAYIHGGGNGTSVNVTALALWAQAPLTVAPAVSWSEVNVRPFTAPVATAVYLVGQIYMCIFTFMIAQAHLTARTLVRRHLRFRSYLALRIAAPLIIYFPLSLSLCLVSLAFDLPFGARYTHAQGFLLFFVFTYLTMAAVGLALEAAITLLGPRFTPFFLFALIVYNVSPVPIPSQLQPAIFRYGAGFPFVNLAQAIRTIIFDTYSHLSVNAAVLIGWVLLSCVTVSGLTWGVHWWERRQERRPENGKRTSKEQELRDS